jgi:hypothetical protein
MMQSTRKARSSKSGKQGSIRYLVQHAWGCANSYLCKLRKSQKDFATATAMTNEAADLLFVAPAPSMDPEGATLQSVIEDYELAETVYATAFIYAVNECHCEAKENLDIVNRESYTKRFLDAKRSFESSDKNINEVWESKRRSHLLRQPRIMNEIISILKKNPKSSYWRHMEKSINRQCGDSTIRKWVTSKKGFKVYAELIIPLLSDAQQKKHLDFGKHFRSNWGLGGGKYLLVHHDEKWFWGLIVCGDAKSCEELVIDPVTFAASHKSHIGKVMATAVVTVLHLMIALKIKLGFLYCVQTPKIARKLQKQSVRQPVGSLKQSGPVVRQKGGLYLVDCCITGSFHGTPKDPKFALKNMFELYVFPESARLVGPGQEHEGSIPIIQGDNAGPHGKAKFNRFMTEYHESKGWHRKPQAPQIMLQPSSRQEG